MDGVVFAKYIKRLREEQGISQDALCEGLCDRKDISFFERNEREISYLLQEALLDRLGVGAENEEHYLDYEEYDCWELRSRILHNIAFDNIKCAEELLGKYIGCCDMENRLERQFVLVQRAQIEKLKGVDGSALYALYDEAVELTVPEADNRPLGSRVLSIKELNLLLEREQYREDGGRLEQYIDTLKYVEAKAYDKLGMAKTYPKTVLFLCRKVLEQSDVAIRQGGTVARLLELCNNAIEVLRDASRIYYIWELFETFLVVSGMRLDEIAKTADAEGVLSNRKQKERQKIENRRDEICQWMDVLAPVFDKYHVQKETTNYCFLYIQKGCHSINDVIRIRRIMYGMSVKELCEGVCSEKTLRRLEQRKSKPQQAIVRELFEKLGLPTELTCGEVITASPEVKQRMEALRDDLNNLYWESAMENIKRVREKLAMENKRNVQSLMQKMLVTQWNQGQIELEDFRDRMKVALELTLPFEAIFSEGQKYFTKEEQICIRNMIRSTERMSTEFMEFMHCIKEYYNNLIEKDMIDTEFGIAVPIIRYIASELGNQGNFDESDRYLHTLLEGSIRFRRSGSLATCFYGLWWNYLERKKQKENIEEVNEEELLTKCVILGKIDKQNKRTEFYEEKLKQLINNYV